MQRIQGRRAQASDLRCERRVSASPVPLLQRVQQSVRFGPFHAREARGSSGQDAPSALAAAYSRRTVSYSVFAAEMPLFYPSLRLEQQAAAGKLGISQPRLNDLLRGKIDKFSLDALFDLAPHAGLQVSIRLKRAA
jgi:hypothetical protein